MITQLATIVAATLGLLMTVGDGSVAKPTCCAKRAYCCSSNARCCGRGMTLEKPAMAAGSLRRTTHGG